VFYPVDRVTTSLSARYFSAFGAAATVLDVGCGAGELGLYAPSGVVVYGVDLNPKVLEQASAYEKTSRVDLNTEGLPFVDGYFDAVLAKDILEHLDQPWQTVAEIFRVLRPGGVVVASLIMARPSRVWADYTHIRGFTRASARSLFEDAGFSVEDVWPMGPVPLSRRLGLLSLVPSLLSVPGFFHLWGASWELKASKPG
jgi:SAM-dependent methyltransferase